MTSDMGAWSCSRTNIRLQILTAGPLTLSLLSSLTSCCVYLRRQPSMKIQTVSRETQVQPECRSLWWATKIQSWFLRTMYVSTIRYCFWAVYLWTQIKQQCILKAFLCESQRGLWIHIQIRLPFTRIGLCTSIYKQKRVLAEWRP